MFTQADSVTRHCCISKVFVRLSKCILARSTHNILDNDQQNLWMSRSTYWRILDACKARTLRRLTCVDYYQAAGKEAFLTLSEMLDHFEDGHDTRVADAMSKLRDAQFYLESSYSIHVKTESKVASHCSTFGLSMENKEYDFA